MTDYSKVDSLKEILQIVKADLDDPGPENGIGYTMPDGLHHIFIYVDVIDDEKVYVIEPNRVENGAHEPFVGDTYIVPFRDFTELVIGCQWCFEHFEFDKNQHQKVSKDGEVRVDLGFATLVAERGSDPNYREVFIGLEDKDGSWIQDIAVIGGKYHYDDNNIVYEENVSVLVYADQFNEDYTHEFSVGVYSPEEEPTRPSLDAMIHSAEGRSVTSGSKVSPKEKETPQKR